MDDLLQVAAKYHILYEDLSYSLIDLLFQIPVITIIMNKDLVADDRCDSACVLVFKSLPDIGLLEVRDIVVDHDLDLIVELILQLLFDRAQVLLGNRQGKLP